MKRFTISSLAAVAFALVIMTQGCYVSKPLERDVHVSIDPNFPINITNKGTSNFSGKHTVEEYRKYYMDELIHELSLNHVIADNVSPEFQVVITSLEIQESTKLDTIKDVKSKDNGRIEQLALANLKTSGKVIRISDGTTGTWDADKDDNEKVTNSKNVEQIVTGENKDNTVYRKKGFDDSEFLTESAYCGRRAAVRIEKEIGRLLK